MKKILSAIVTMSILVVGVGYVAHADVATLRGAIPLDSDSESFERRKQFTKDGNIERSWKQQPPSIPHKIEKDQITLQVNTCLRCHDAANYKKEKAPKIGDSHFIAADKTELDKMDMRRYFCNQCHTPQLDVKPLIENTFQTIKQSE